MSLARFLVLCLLLPALTAVASGQESPMPAPGLRITALHADSGIQSSILSIRATDNGGYSEVNTFGVHPAATYCLDGELEPGLIEIPFPPKPPAGVFDFRFSEHRAGSTCLGTGLKNHLQEPGKLDTFKLEFQPGDGGYPMRLSWKDAAARIAADWESLVLVDGLGGLLGVNIDMKADTAVDIPSSLINTLFIIGRTISNVTRYTIDATAGAGGAIQPGGFVLVDSGETQSFSITPSPGHTIGGVFVDGVNVGPVSGYTFTNVTANHTIRATFTASLYQIAASAGTGGTISPGGPILIPAGGSQTFSILANPGYQTADVIVDGVSLGPLAQYSFTNVTAAHTIHATFMAPQHYIVASAGTGGTISPAGSVRVPAGGDQTFLVRPNPGYRTDNVIVDDVSLGPLAQYSFTNVTGNHVISAWFMPAGGTSPTVVLLTGRDAGTGTGSATFGVHPNATYCLDGELATGLREQELPPRPPAGVFDLRFTEHRSGSSCLGAGTRFHLQEPGRLDTFKIEIQQGIGGYPVTLSWPAGLASGWTSLTIRDVFGGTLVNADMLTRTSLVLTNSLINSLYIVGISGSPARTFSIDASAGPGGSINPQGRVTVDSGANRSFTALPDPGYVVDSILVDGARVAETSNYTFTNVAADHSIRVDFRRGVRTGYRTLTAADLAVHPPNKKQHLYYRFSFRLVNSSLQTATGLRINFGGSASTAITIESSVPFGSATTPDGKEWNFADGAVGPWDTIVISGTSLGRPANIHRWNWWYHTVAGGNQSRFDPPGQRGVYPMPNAANVREELFQGGFGPEGLTVGIPRNDSARYYGWVRMDRGSQLQRSLVQRGRVHTGAARCFDFVKQRRTLTPSIQDNVLFANQAALKFNLRMSLLGVTPVGLRSLVFQDTVPNPLDGMTIGGIAEYADSLLSGRYVGSVHVCESVSLFEQVNGTIERINAAFAGPMDTVAYAAGTVLAAVREAGEIPFLRPSPHIDTVALAWDRSGTELLPPPALTLFQNYPNPFNPVTTIRFSVPADAIVSAVVYDQLGRQVAVLHDNEYLMEGEQETDFDASTLGSGLYFCRISILTTGDPEEGVGSRSETAVVRMLLVK